MPTGTEVNSAVTAGILSVRRAEEMLAEAVRAKTQIQLAPSESFLRPCVWGVLTEADEGKLVIEIERVSATPEQLYRLRRLYATLELRESRFFFDAVLLDAANVWGRGTLVEFNWPPIIAVEERRRSQRRKFRQPSTVTLTIVDGSAERSLQASVLNVSLHGMACKLGEEEACGLSVGMRLHADMRIGGSPERFEETVVIANVTPAGSPGHVVLGMEFVKKPSQRFCDVIRTSTADPADGRD